MARLRNLDICIYKFETVMMFECGVDVTGNVRISEPFEQASIQNKTGFSI